MLVGQAGPNNNLPRGPKHVRTHARTPSIQRLLIPRAIMIQTKLLTMTTKTMIRAASSALKQSALSSIGFSGAGFLTCYHLGVAECLLQHGFLSKSSSRSSTMLTGVSGGALCAAGVAVGVSPDDGMATLLHVQQSTVQQGRLDALTPGFSLIDQVEEVIARDMKRSLGGTASKHYQDYDIELLQKRLKNSVLRIGVTDRRVFPPNPRAYYYIDTFRSVDDVVAACILSSYIPFITGPLQGSLHASNLAVKRSQERIQEMVELGYVKNGITGEPLPPSKHDREYFWDGGIVNVFPIVNEETIIVTPIIARFTPNPYISPALETDTARTIRLDERSQVLLNRANAETLRQMTLSSDETVLQQRFSQGHDDAT